MLRILGPRARGILTLALGLAALRLVGMAWLPYMDTSEPRYAEIARLMVQTGDWITPWFEPGIPFWGKPPLSFWLQAASMKLFGLSEMAGRLPAWLAVLATLYPIHAVARAWAGRRAAACAVLLYTTCALPYMTAGAVLTDPFLALGTTLVMAGLVLPQRHWRILAVAGLAIGLLAKGPLAVVLVAGPLAVHRLCYGSRQWAGVPLARALSGAVLAVALAAPWYIVAELKTPGFLDYFIVGEHVRRFLDPGWGGDMYGTAHRSAFGGIWVGWLQAAMPWGPIALAALAAGLRRESGRRRLRMLVARPMTGYLLAWALFTPAFFTASSNILWTYVLPALPAFAILAARQLAIAMRRVGAVLPQRKRAWPRRGIVAAACATPIAMLTATLVLAIEPQLARSEREVIQYVDTNAPAGARLWYVGTLPFSARYYSHGHAERIPRSQVAERLASVKGPVYIAASPTDMDHLRAVMKLQIIDGAQSRRYVLARATIPERYPLPSLSYR